MDATRPSTAHSGPDRIAWARAALVVYWPVLALFTHWPRLNVRVQGRSLGDIGVDKAIHYVAFAALAMVLSEARPLGRHRSALASLFAAAVLAAGYGYADEYTQRWVERTFSQYDLLANLLGVLSGAAVMWLIETRRRETDAAGGSCLGENTVLPATAGMGSGQANEPATHSPASLHPMAAPPAGAGTAFIARLALVVLSPLVTLLLLVPGFTLDVGLPLGWYETLSPGMQAALRADRLVHACGAMALLWMLAAARPLGLGRAWAARGLAVAATAGLGPVIELAQVRVGRGFERGDMIAHGIGLGLGVLLGGIYLVAMRMGQRRATAGAAMAGGKDWGEAPSESADAGSGGRRGFVRNAMVVSVLTFLSRITGLVRDAWLAGAFGVGAVSDAFWFGFAVPNLFRRLFGEGALTAALIPVYTDLVHKDRELARRLGSLCLTLTAVVLGAATLLGEAILWAVLVSRDWSGDTVLALKLTMVMLPYMPLVCLVAIIGGLLQVHGRFAPAAGMPVFLNLVMIVGTAAALWSGDVSDPALIRAAYVVGLSVVAAGLVQLVLQGLALYRHLRPTGRFDGVGEPMRAILRAFVPMLLALAVFQINTFLDTMICFALSPKDGGDEGLHLLGRVVSYPIEPGGVAALQWSQRLYQFPLGVFGLAIATAIFPALAHAAASPGEQGLEEFRRTFRQGLRLTVFIGLPASVGLILVRVPLCRVIYERGQFDLDASLRVAGILAGYAPAIWAYSMTHVITRAFYALKDPRTPMVVSALMVGLNLILNLLLVWPLGAAGLAWSTAVCAALQCVVLILALRNYVDHPVDAGVVRAWARTALLTALMAAALGPLTWVYDPTALSARQSLALLAGMVALGGAVVALGAWLLGCEEVGWLLRRRRKARNRNGAATQQPGPP